MKEAEATSLFDKDSNKDSRGQTCAVHDLVNTIGSHLESWRGLKNPADWEGRRQRHAY